MLNNLFYKFVSAIVAYLMTKILEFYNGKQLQKKTDEEIDQSLQGVKDAYKKAFNGFEVTKTQRAELNKSIADFLRNSNGGL